MLTSRGHITFSPDVKHKKENSENEYV